MSYYYRIYNKNKKKFLYRMGTHWSYNLKKILSKPLFTEKEKIASLYETKKQTEADLDKILEYEYDQINHTLKKSIEDNYEIRRYKLCPIPVEEYLKYAERGEYFFQVKNKTNNKFVKKVKTGSFSFSINYSKTKGRLYLEYSHAKNFINYASKDICGWKSNPPKNKRKEFINSFEVIAFILEDEIYRRKILLEKIKN